jgi:hypothetical protein
MRRSSLWSFLLLILFPCCMYHCFSCCPAQKQTMLPNFAPNNMFYRLMHLLLLYLVIFKLKCNNLIFQWNSDFICSVCVFAAFSLHQESPNLDPRRRNPHFCDSITVGIRARSGLNTHSYHLKIATTIMVMTLSPYKDYSRHLSWQANLCMPLFCLWKFGYLCLACRTLKWVWKYWSARGLSGHESAGPLRACVKVADYYDPTFVGTLTCIKSLETFVRALCHRILMIHNSGSFLLLLVRTIRMSCIIKSPNQ